MEKYAQNGICVEELDDSENESDASERVTAPKKLSAKKNKNGKQDGEMNPSQNYSNNYTYKTGGIKSCPTAELSSINAFGSHEFKSATDYLFSVRVNKANNRSENDSPPEYPNFISTKIESKFPLKTPPILEKPETVHSVEEEKM